MTSNIQDDDQVIHVEGIDEEPVETNRRLFTGSNMAIVATLSMLYALVHMLALNGVSIYEWTGMSLPFFAIFSCGNLELSDIARGRRFGAWLYFICRAYVFRR